MTEPVPQPGAEHQQSAEGRRITARDQAACRDRCPQLIEHVRQGGDHDRHAQHVDELDQAYGDHPGPR